VRLDGRQFPSRVVALTWDDGPDLHTLELAKYLSQRNVFGTFFVVHSWAAGVSNDPGESLVNATFRTGYSHVPVLGDLVALGHRLGNHTLQHVMVEPSLNPETIADQLRDNQRNLDAFITNEWRMFRAPGGAWDERAQTRISRDPYLATMTGPLAWDIDGKDWEMSLRCAPTDPRSTCEPRAAAGGLRMKPAALARRYEAAIREAGRGIVLLHDRVGDVGSRYSLEVARELIPSLQREGFVFASPVLRFGRLASRVVGAGAGAADATAGGDDDSCIVPSSGVVMRDVTGDGRADVCGLVGSGCAGASDWRCAFSSAAFQHDDAQSQRVVTRFRVAQGPSVGYASFLTEPHVGYNVYVARFASWGSGRAHACLADDTHVQCWAIDSVGAAGDESRRWRSSRRARVIGFADIDGDGSDDVCRLSRDDAPSASVHCAILSHAADVTSGEAALGDRSWLTATHLVSLSSNFTLADVDGDGRADLCGVDAGPERSVWCALSRGSHFAAPTRWTPATVTAPAWPHGVVFGDLNRDGRSDVCGVLPDGGVACALSTGSSFTAATEWMPPSELGAAFDGHLKETTDGVGASETLESVHLADINADGRADLCVVLKINRGKLTDGAEASAREGPASRADEGGGAASGPKHPRGRTRRAGVACALAP